MELDNEICIIRHLANNITNNCIEIAFRLKKIRDSKTFRPKYNSFTEMLNKEQLGFKYSDGFVSRLLKFIEDPQLVSLAKEIGITKTFELLAVPDRESREQIAEKAIKEDLTKVEIRDEVKKVKISPDKPPLLNTQDEVKFKLLREYNAFNLEIPRIIYEVKDIKEKHKIWEEKAKRFNELSEKRGKLLVQMNE